MDLFEVGESWSLDGVSMCGTEVLDKSQQHPIILRVSYSRHLDLQARIGYANYEPAPVSLCFLAIFSGYKTQKSRFLLHNSFKVISIGGNNLE